MIHEELRDITQKDAGKDVSPSLGLIDSQSVKTTRSGGLWRGIDGGKKRAETIYYYRYDGLTAGNCLHRTNEHDSYQGN